MTLKTTEEPKRKRGAPVKKIKSISVSIRFEPEIYYLLYNEAIVNGFFKGGKPNISKAVKEVVKKTLL
jgi:hypothetical protein